MAPCMAPMSYAALVTSLRTARRRATGLDVDRHAARRTRRGSRSHTSNLGVSRDPLLKVRSLIDALVQRGNRHPYYNTVAVAFNTQQT